MRKMLTRIFPIFAIASLISSVCALVMMIASPEPPLIPFLTAGFFSIATIVMRIVLDDEQKG